MNKTELIEHIANNADMPKAAAARALEATIDAVKKTLRKGGTVSLVGFGTFAVGTRAARTGRNPRTGAAISIKAAIVTIVFFIALNDLRFHFISSGS